MNIYNRFKRLKFWNKLGAIGAIASIIGLSIAIAVWLKNGNDQDIEVRGSVVDSYIIQIRDSESVEFGKIISAIERKNRKLDSLAQELKETKTFLLNKELERISKYFPSGYKKETYTLGPSEFSEKLKRVFVFSNRNFGKQITGKQLKEIDSILTEILETEPLFGYGWFYRGLNFTFLRNNKPYGEKFKNIAHTQFNRADNLFSLLLDKYPENPYLLLYKGMNLTHLNRGRESVLYLNEALRIEPIIFSKHRLLGIICYWKHIKPEYSEVWESAFKKYWEKG